MCWKNEWARAVNNLTSAIVHINRAKEKVEARGLSVAVERSQRVILTLEHVQKELGCMVDTYGIRRVETSLSTQRIMRGKRKVRMVR